MDNREHWFWSAVRTRGLAGVCRRLERELEALLMNTAPPALGSLWRPTHRLWLAVSLTSNLSPELVSTLGELVAAIEGTATGKAGDVRDVVVRVEDLADVLGALRPATN